MNIIVNANKKVFKEATEVCEALLELMKDKLKEELEARENVGRVEGERDVKFRLIQTKLSKGKTVEAIADDLEESVENILTLMKEMDKKEENK